MIRVLGIDPGYDRMGVAVVEKDGDTETLLHLSCLTSDKTAGGPERLAEIGDGLAKICKKYKPSRVALETLFFNKNQKTAMSVAEARGVAIYVAKTHGAAVYEYPPQSVKVAVTGYGKSDKAAVEAMLFRLLPNLPKDALDDEYDAVAVALTCLASEKK